MTTRTSILTSITAALIAGVATANAHAQAFPEKPDYKFEKCFGVAKAARNDCTTAQHSCGSLGTADADPNDWIYTPKGTCQRLVNGKLGPAT